MMSTSVIMLLFSLWVSAEGFQVIPSTQQANHASLPLKGLSSHARGTLLLFSSNTEEDTSSSSDEVPLDYEIPEDAVIVVKPNAMKRLRELKVQQKTDNLVLRMGVRNGGCSGMSYVMDFSTLEAVEEDDAVDEYEGGEIICVVDAKSMLYLYGLQLDYSDDLIGGGFKFFNPNAEESCGCGSSFGI